MIQKDIQLALKIVGLWIDRMERHGNKDDVLMEFKHAYLRINWYILKNSLFFPSLTPTKEEWQEIVEKVHELSPTWLPCHKSPLQDHHQPCNSHSKSCRCAELLQCDISEVV
jgi:hypothetical protein